MKLLLDMTDKITRRIKLSRGFLLRIAFQTVISPKCPHYIPHNNFCSPFLYDSYLIPTFFVYIFSPACHVIFHTSHFNQLQTLTGCSILNLMCTQESRFVFTNCIHLIKTKFLLIPPIILFPSENSIKFVL